MSSLPTCPSPFSLCPAPKSVSDAVAVAMAHGKVERVGLVPLLFTFMVFHLEVRR